jgi:hypothetical protein
VYRKATKYFVNVTKIHGYNSHIQTKEVTTHTIPNQDYHPHEANHMVKVLHLFQRIICATTPKLAH